MTRKLEGKGDGLQRALFFRMQLEAFNWRKITTSEILCEVGQTLWEGLEDESLAAAGVRAYGEPSPQRWKKPSASVHTCAVYAGTLAQVLQSPSYLTTQIMPVHLILLPLERSGNDSLSL